MPLEIGQLIKGRYRLTESIREGGFAVVFRAQDLEENRDVAIKFMKANAFVSEDSFTRFRNEATQMMQLPHKNILAVYDVDLSSNEMPLLVTEYLPWRSLREILLEKKCLSYEDCKEIFSQICSGLAFAHSNGIIHRDLSPSHIVISEGEKERCVKIIDFGASRQLRESTGRSITITQLSKTGKLIGNPAFMSPETTMGEKADKVSDIYSLGCVLYMMLCGHPPFESKAPLELILKHQREFPQEPQFDWKNQDIEAAKFKYIVLRCVQKERNKRFQSVDEIINCIDSEKDNWNQIAGLSSWKKPEANKGAQTGQLSVTPTSRRMKTSLLMLVFLLLLLTVLGLCYESMRQQRESLATSLTTSQENAGFKAPKASNLEDSWLTELKRQEQVFGQGNPRTFNLVFRIAQLYQAEGKNREAETYFQKSLAMKEDEFGKNSAETAPVILALANLYKTESKYAEASELYKKTMAPDTATELLSLEGLAECCRNSGKDKEAVVLYKQAIALAEKTKAGSAPADLARCLIGLSACMQTERQRSAGDDYFARGLGLLEKANASDAECASMEASLRKYSEYLHKTGKIEAARRLGERIEALHSKVTAGKDPE